MSAGDPVGGAHDAPPDTQVGPPTAGAFGARTLYDSRLRCSSRIAMPKLWSPYLYFMFYKYARYYY